MDGERTGDPVVSVVVPAYRNGAFIERTMESILAQTYPRLEVIVADHSSDDDTWERLQRFAADPRVTLATTPASGGAPANWRRVTELATGEYLKLVCGDDVIRPELVARQVAALEANPGAVLSATKRDIVDAAGVPLITGRGLAGLRGTVPGRTAIRRTVTAGTNVLGEPACVLFRTSAFREAGGWDDRWPYLIDEASYARVLLLGDLEAIDDSLAEFRVSAGQWSVALSRSQAAQAIGFHRAVRSAHPDIVSGADVAIGNARARANAFGRRAVYALHAKRLRAAA
ncbi:MAG: glycosyltransferase family 2 protein [Microbacteriaceae bacterium]|nr:glycosyltransferase family 2 protein [Microbacteriaceae bacterium]